MSQGHLQLQMTLILTQYIFFSEQTSRQKLTDSSSRRGIYLFGCWWIEWTDIPAIQVEVDEVDSWMTLRLLLTTPGFDPYLEFTVIFPLATVQFLGSQSLQHVFGQYIEYVEQGL